MEVEGSSRQYLRWKPAYVAEDERKQIVSQRSTVDIALENAEIWQHNEQHGNTVDRDGDVGCCGYILMTFSVLLLISLFPFSLLFSIKVISEFERAVIFRLGRVINGAKGPGMIFVFPCVEQMLKVDLRTVAYDVPPQEILTKDSVTVSVDAVIYYRVSDPVMSICNVTDAVRSAQLLSATVLRNVMGMKVMAEVLTERDHMAMLMQEMLDKATDAWGIKVERVEIKDVRLPLQLQRAMAAEAEAAREARAKVVAAEGEQNASRPLKEAADVIMESPAALQLRYLQTLGSIATESSSTMLFPVPINMLSAFVKKDDKTDNSFTASYREESFKRSYDKIDEMNFTKEEGFTEFGQEERKKRENSLDFLDDEKRSETLRLSDTKIQYDVTPENELEFLSGLVQSVQGWQQGETSISTNTSQSSTAHLRSGVSETEQTSHDSMNFAVESEVHRRHSTDVNGHPRQRLPVEVVQIDNHMEGGTNNVGTEENIELRSGGSSSVHIHRGRHSTKIVIGEHQPT